MSNQEIGVANGWEDIGEDEKHSTIAFFKGGARCVVEIDDAEKGDEVLIWQGVPELVEDGTGTAHEVTVFEGYEEVPDGADYVVETMKNDKRAAVNGRFAQDLEEAKEIAREEVQNVSDGVY